MSETDELLAQVNEKLDRILAVLLIKDKEQDEQIRMLRSLGHDWEFIGAATGLTADAARMQMSRHQRGAKRRGKGGH